MRHMPRATQQWDNCNGVLVGVWMHKHHCWVIPLETHLTQALEDETPTVDGSGWHEQ